MCVKEEFPMKPDVIRRFQPTLEETAPWTGIEFIHPVGSDQLADLLKSTYPDGLTLRHRKHMAAIDFLKGELKKMQPMFTGSSSTNEQADHQSIRSTTSEFSAGDTFLVASRPQSELSHTSPSISSIAASPRLVERLRPATEQNERSDALPPILATASHTYVFSAVNGKPMQPKTKRRMTIQERQAYKETRKRGACLKCRRTKGKCTHRDGSGVGPNEMGEMKRANKRSGSLELDEEQPGATKLLKLEDRSPVQRRSSVTARLPLPPDMRPTHNDRFGAEPDRLESFDMPTTGDGQWGPGQSEVYVQLSSSEPFRNVLPASNGQGWTPFSDGPAMNGQSHPVYPVGGPQAPRDNYSPSPLDDGLHNQYPFGYPWNSNG